MIRAQLETDERQWDLATLVMLTSVILMTGLYFAL
jgi:hypothetical protein